VNFLGLLGWSPKENREKFTLAETIERFDPPQILRHNARFNYNSATPLPTPPPSTPRA
jgi:glutamyl/glutaminyl-tRNA synthetase